MLEALDRLLLTHVAQPAVDALQIEPTAWSRSAARTSSAAFMTSCLGIALLLVAAGRPFDCMAMLILGAAHVSSVQIDAYAGKLHRDGASASFGRLFQIAETLMCTWLLTYVAKVGSAPWTALICVFLAALLIADAVAYVSICDKPPPPRRRNSRTMAGSGA